MEPSDVDWIKAGFIECDTCRAQPGTPPLCKGCLHNRLAIQHLSTMLDTSRKGAQNIIDATCDSSDLYITYPSR